MTLAIACIAWVIASTIVALLPMRHQYIPGVALMVVAPVLMLWIGISVAWWASLLALAAFVSMFRNPLRYFLAKWSCAWAQARSAHGPTACRAGCGKGQLEVGIGAVTGQESLEACIGDLPIGDN